MAKIRVTENRVLVGTGNSASIRVTQVRVNVAALGGKARLSRQRVLVAVEGGTLKLTQQRLLVLWGQGDPLLPAIANVLTFSQIVDDGFTSDRKEAGNLLQITQSLGRNIEASVSSSLSLEFDTSANKGQVTNKSVQNTVNFEQNANRVKLLPTKTASNTLTIVSETVGGFRLVLNTLLITHSAVGEIPRISLDADTELSFSQSVSLGESVFNRSADTELIFIHTGSYNGIFNRSASSLLQFNHLAFGVIVPTKKYVLLQAPYGCFQTSLVLPSPLFGDTENLISNINLRKSMNSETYTYVKSSKSKVLKYTFRMTRIKAIEFERFCKIYNSSEIKLQNWKGEVWKVNIITNPIDFVQTGRDSPTQDRTDVNIEFEGVRING